MSDVTLFGFPRSVYVQMAGIVLTHKEVQYAFHDLETEMNTPGHIALHPFERVPILRHGGFTVYETSAIVSYVDDAFDGPSLTPSDPQMRAHMNQWISTVNAYYYPYLILSCIARTQCLPAAWHCVRREGRCACNAEGRNMFADA